MLSVLSMARGRWKKHSALNKQIIAILSAQREHLTTNEILVLLDKKHNVKLSWHTLNKYLVELAEVGHVMQQTLERAQRSIWCWTVRGIKEVGEDSKTTGEAAG